MFKSISRFFFANRKFCITRPTTNGNTLYIYLTYYKTFFFNVLRYKKKKLMCAASCILCEPCWSLSLPSLICKAFRFDGAKKYSRYDLYTVQPISFLYHTLYMNRTPEKSLKMLPSPDLVLCFEEFMEKSTFKKHSGLPRFADEIILNRARYFFTFL